MTSYTEITTVPVAKDLRLTEPFFVKWDHEKVVGKDYDVESRWYCFFDLDPVAQESRLFTEALQRAIDDGNPNIVEASREEIDSGRTRNGDRIAPHARYLYEKHRNHS